jgi:hypothetical protein
LSEYVEFLENECKEENILFRGQQRQHYALLPRIARGGQEDILEMERFMLADLKREAIPYLQIMPENDWEWLAVAQQHGMATRLLDWTWNSLGALWFAVNEPPEKGPMVWFGRSLLETMTK